jgi:hypothetical protein
VGIVGKVLGIWKDSGITEAQLQERLNLMKEEMTRGAVSHEKGEAQFRGDLVSAISELRAVTLTIAKLSSGQDIINSVTTKTLDSLSRKMDEYDKQVAELAGSISFIRQLFERMERQGK